jgi:hypothetical protein
MGIEREECEPDQWASPMAISKMDKSRGSTNDSLFYFTAASELSGSSQESHWGLESTDGGSADEFNYICDLKTGDVAVVSKKDPQDVVIWQQPRENLDTLEAEPTCTDKLSPTRSLLDSFETQSLVVPPDKLFCRGDIPTQHIQVGIIHIQEINHSQNYSHDRRYHYGNMSLGMLYLHKHTADNCPAGRSRTAALVQTVVPSCRV